MRRILLLVSAATLLSCSDSTSPAGVPDPQLHIVQQDTTAPPLVGMQGSFWAKVGEDRELRLNYQAPTPADSQDEFLRFEVPGDGLLRKPDGTAFQSGDSILITITVDTAKFQFRFEPSGLQFNPNSPARLQIEYDHANHDYNDDGVIDSADSTIGHTLGLWRRENATAPWFQQTAVKFEGLEEFDANILSFTEYAIAW